MPSIRIKGTPYASLRDAPAANEPRSLAEIFPSNAPGSPTPTNRVPPRMQRSMPVMRETNDPSSTSPENSQSRPRAGTMSSRIYNHVVQREQRAAPIDNGSQPSTSRTASPLLVAHNGMVTMEGSQADIRIRASGERGRIDSAINLPNAHLDATHMRLVDSSETHHDDIVEHLDVIGEFYVSLSIQDNNRLLLPSDPQVSTLSSLTNAANTILMCVHLLPDISIRSSFSMPRPPLSWYSRKPVFILTSPPTPKLDAEVGDHKDDGKRFEDSLDRHVDDVLRRPSKFRRTMKGVWSFLKTRTVASKSYVESLTELLSSYGRMSHH